MRKVSRQMSAEWALEVFDKAPYVTVSMTDEDGMPYGLPLSLVRVKNENDDENLSSTCSETNVDKSFGVFYFHCAKEGKKLDLLSQNPRVCLSAVTKCKPTVGPKDGSFTLEFKSAIAFGMAEMVEDETEKTAAMRAICERFLPHHMDAFEASIARSLGRTAVVRITLTEPPVGKRKQYDKQGEEMKAAIK